MFREDIIWFIPVVIIALIQVKIIWGTLPSYNAHETDIPGSYSEIEILQISYYIRVAYIIFFMQLVFPILTITNDAFLVFLLRVSGYLFVLVGFWMSIIALKSLGENWSGMGYYRIKKGQKLVTTGIYHFVRHPIYTAAILESIGFELIVNSWLVMLVLIIGYWITSRHVIKEEKLLQLKFGKEFENYKVRTGCLFPKFF